MRQPWKYLSVIVVMVLFCEFPLALVGGGVAPQRCFIAKEGAHVHASEGACKVRHSPCSTFKIALALIGFDEGILQSSMAPVWSPQPTDSIYMNAHRGPHDPRTWMRDSVVWYSQQLTRTLGMERFRARVASLGYGNSDVAGIPGQSDGLTEAWLMSSLQLSPEEHVSFLQRLVDRALPIGSAALEQTRTILFLEELWGGWKLFGKIGSGFVQDAQLRKLDLPQGWFVGWIEKGARRIPFASFVADPEAPQPSSLEAKAQAIHKLFFLINTLEGAPKQP